MDTKATNEDGSYCEITPDPLRPVAVARTVWTPKQGAIVTFTGIVRDHSGERKVTRMQYEAYAEMALEEMRRILSEARECWPQVRLAAAHRVGVLDVGELSVVVVAGSAHREPAFEAAGFTIGEIKRRAPIWKKEYYEEGGAWVGLEPSGDSA